MEDHELNRLLNRLIEGSISQDDFDRLQHVLRADRQAREAYYDLLGVDLLLAEQYEVPDYIAVQSQAMDQSWALKRARRGIVAWSAAGAAAVLLVTLGTLFVFRSQPSAVTLTASNDSHFSVNGVEVTTTTGTLGANDSLELKHGVVSLALGPYVEACLEGPAQVRLLNGSGDIELKQGAAYFQIAPGSKDFEVHTPAGIIHDIGTKFGVQVLANGRVETHVTAGAVDIERNEGEARHRVDAGAAVSWTRKDSIRPATLDPNRFVQSLPWYHVVLKDDFDDTDGTPLAGKAPDAGQPWKVLFETNPTTVSRGKLDTSYGPRTLSAGLLENGGNGRRSVYVTTFTTAVPENIGDKAGYFDAAENVTLWDKDGRSIFSIGARASRDHRWQLKDEATGTLSIGTRVSALEAHTLTLSYERESGTVRLYEGTSTQGQLLDELKAKPAATPGFLTISNAEGGDLSIDSLEVRIVTYPQESKPSP